jgi:hypothetical protein
MLQFDKTTNRGEALISQCQQLMVEICVDVGNGMWVATMYISGTHAVRETNVSIPDSHNMKFFFFSFTYLSPK